MPKHTKKQTKEAKRGRTALLALPPADPFARIPYDAWAIVVLHLSTTSLWTLRKVCSGFRTLLDARPELYFRFGVRAQCHPVAAINLAMEAILSRRKSLAGAAIALVDVVSKQSNMRTFHVERVLPALAATAPSHAVPLLIALRSKPGATADARTRLAPVLAKVLPLLPFDELRDAVDNLYGFPEAFDAVVERLTRAPDYLLPYEIRQLFSAAQPPQANVLDAVLARCFGMFFPEEAARNLLRYLAASSNKLTHGELVIGTLSPIVISALRVPLLPGTELAAMARYYTPLMPRDFWTHDFWTRDALETLLDYYHVQNDGPPPAHLPAGAQADAVVAAGEALIRPLAHLMDEANYREVLLSAYLLATQRVLGSHAPVSFRDVERKYPADLARVLLALPVPVPQVVAHKIRACRWFATREGVEEWSRYVTASSDDEVSGVLARDLGVVRATLNLLRTRPMGIASTVTFLRRARAFSVLCADELKAVLRAVLRQQGAADDTLTDAHLETALRMLPGLKTLPKTAGEVVELWG